MGDECAYGIRVASLLTTLTTEVYHVVLVCVREDLCCNVLQKALLITCQSIIRDEKEDLIDYEGEDRVKEILSLSTQDFILTYFDSVITQLLWTWCWTYLQMLFH